MCISSRTNHLALLTVIMLMFTLTSCSSDRGTDANHPNRQHTLGHFSKVFPDSQISYRSWWDRNWQQAKILTINAPCEGYQMPITIYKEDGYDDPVNNSVDCEGHCKDEFSDVRFVATDNARTLSHWVEAVDSDGTSKYARVWIRTNGNRAILMYYGNPSALPASDGYATFDFFDNFDTFDTSVWNEYDPNDAMTISAENGLLHLSFGNVYGGTTAGVVTADWVGDNGLLVAKTKGERGSNPWNQPFYMEARIDADNVLYNRYWHTGNSAPRYRRNFGCNGAGHAEQYCADAYPSLQWRVIYLKKLLDWQAAGAFTDYYDWNRIGFESVGEYSINGPFSIKLQMRTFNSGLDGYYDWIFLAKYSLTGPTWNRISAEQTCNL